MNRSTAMWLLVAVGCAEGTGGDDRRPDPAARAPLPEGSPSDAPAVVFLGDSLTAGRGLDPQQAFPALVRERIEERGFAVVDAGRSGDTTRGGRSRLSWVLRGDVAVVVLALGGNDMLRGVPLEETEANLRGLVAEIRARDPRTRVVLAGMRALPNLGAAYCEAFDGLYPRLSRELGTAAIPFLLEGVGGEPEFNLPDQIHPNVAGHERIARTVWSVLDVVLEEIRAEWPGPENGPDGAEGAR